MAIRLRQIAVVAADLQKAAAEITGVLGVEPCFADPHVQQFGLKNMLWPIGNQMLEVVTPIADGTAAGRYLDRRNGDGGYMVITQVDDVAHRRQRAADLGVRVAFELRYPGEGQEGIQLHPGDTGGSFFEMDEVSEPGGDEPDGPWHPAGSNWKPYVNTSRVSGISAAELQSPDPQRLANRWSEIAEIDLTSDADGHPSLQLDNATLRFVEDTDGRGEGLGAIDITTTKPVDVDIAADQMDCRTDLDNQVMIAGLRVNI